MTARRRARTPAEKKRLALTRDRPLSAKYPKAFRKQWPIKKARAARSYRRAQRVALESAVDEVLPVRRATVRKWPQPTLGEVIDAKLARRAVTRTAPRKNAAARLRRRRRRGTKQS